MKPTPIALVLWRLTVATIVCAMAAAVIAFEATSPANVVPDQDAEASPEPLTDASR